MLAGSPKGAAGLSIYDAAAATVAFMDEDWSKTGFTLNPKGRVELLKMIGLPVQTRTEGENYAPPAELAEDQLAEFREMLAPSPVNPPND